MEKAIGGIIGTLVIAVVVLYIIAIAIMIASVLALVVIGIISLVVSKSGNKTLVPQEQIGNAIISSLMWAGALSAGCIIGSVGFMIILVTLGGEEISQRIATTYSFGPNGTWTPIFVYEWLFVDAVKFAGTLTLVLLMSNRIHNARKVGGSAWLSVLPPILGMCTFFVAEHFLLFESLLMQLPDPSISELRAAIVSELITPFSMLVKSFYAPELASSWAMEQLIATNGSFFRLASFFPWLFFVFLISHTVRNVFPHDSLTL